MGQEATGDLGCAYLVALWNDRLAELLHHSHLLQVRHLELPKSEVVVVDSECVRRQPSVAYYELRCDAQLTVASNQVSSRQRQVRAIALADQKKLRSEKSGTRSHFL